MYQAIGLPASLHNETDVGTGTRKCFLIFVRLASRSENSERFRTNLFSCAPKIFSVPVARREYLIINITKPIWNTYVESTWNTKYL